MHVEKGPDAWSLNNINVIYVFAYWGILYVSLSSVVICFEKNILGITSACQTVWIQNRPDLLSGLIWVQTICKGHKQTTLVGKCLKESIWICNPLNTAFHLESSVFSSKYRVTKYNLLQTVWTQIRHDETSGLIWIQTVWNSDGISERNFRKSLFWKKNINRWQKAWKIITQNATN